MKKIAVVILFCLSYSFLFAQTENTSIAPFKIQMTNGQNFTYSDLKKNKDVVLIYFSPTCEHCKAFTRELLKHEKEIASKQFVMVTYVPLDEVKPFMTEFDMNSHPNFKVGTEGYSFIVQKFYHVQRFPFVALYDKDDHLKKILPFREDPVPTVSQIVKFN